LNRAWQHFQCRLAPWCRASCGRLGVEQVGLYQIHWPGFITNGFVNDAFVRGLADCANQGLASAVGVSNFKPERVRSAARILKVINYDRPARKLLDSLSIVIKAG